ncbi:MAG: sodium:calcium antiporter [bacterium]|nr:sodium:calcium antiporter [bacterium]
MKRYMKGLIIIGVLCVFLASGALADVEADKKECLIKTEAAADMMQNEGFLAALAEINRPEGKFVKGEIYVFVLTLDGVVIAHPVSPYLIGKNLIGLKDSVGKEFVKELVDVAKHKGAGWVAYMWPKPGEDEPSEKVSYVVKVDVMFGERVEHYVVAAGIYK